MNPTTSSTSTIMPDINEQCWGVIGAIGGADCGHELDPGAVERLTKMGLVESGAD